MTIDRRFELELPEILEALYLEPASDDRYTLAGRFAATPQRPAWTFPERWLPMSVTTLARQAMRPVPWRTVGLVAVLVLLVLAAIALMVGRKANVPLPYGPARNGLVAFDQDGDIILVDPATGTRTVAIGGPTVDTNPVFSRDGTRLAFYREADGARGLFVADAQGRGAQALSTAALGDFDTLDWSPDGRSILTIKIVAGSYAAIAIVPTDGSSPRVLDVGMTAEDALWLPPDGKEIVFRSPSPDGSAYGYGLYVVRSDGSGGVRELLPAKDVSATRCTTITLDCQWDGLFFAPSPDGSQVAYQLRDPVDLVQKVYLVPVSGGTPRALTEIESVAPVWSSDGAWIGFFSRV